MKKPQKEFYELLEKYGKEGMYLHIRQEDVMRPIQKSAREEGVTINGRLTRPAGRQRIALSNSPEREV